MLLDAFALVAHMVEEPAADEVDTLLHDRDDPPAVSAVNLAETVDRMTRVAGLELTDVVRPPSPSHWCADWPDLPR